MQLRGARARLELRRWVRGVGLGARASSRRRSLSVAVDAAATEPVACGKPRVAPCTDSSNACKRNRRRSRDNHLHPAEHGVDVGARRRGGQQAARPVAREGIGGRPRTALVAWPGRALRARPACPLGGWYEGRATGRPCTCFVSSTPRHPTPATAQVHWLRIILDEGHTLGSPQITNKLAMACEVGEPPRSRAGRDRWRATSPPVATRLRTAFDSPAPAGAPASARRLTTSQRHLLGYPCGPQARD